MSIINKYSQVYSSPYLAGIFMGINAIKDSAIYVDGPDCIFYKADILYKTHDLYSDLKDASINTKIFFSGVKPNRMVRGYDEKIKRKLGFIEENEKFNLGIITCMPVTGLLATQYKHLYSDFKKDFIFVPSFTDKYRIDGYSILLKELAKLVNIDKDKEKKKLNISLIGYLYDRNEGDCIGNIEEIRRILSILGITINSIWLDGSNYKDLSKVEDSQLLISLPYGKHASKILSKRLGIEYLELDIPFGLENTINFINEIGKKLGISNNKIDEFITKEVVEIKNKIDGLNQKVFINKSYVYAGDPFLENSIKDIGNFLGMNFIKSYNYTGSKEAQKEDLNIEKLDIVIGNSEFEIQGLNYTKFEFGFPSYNTHFLLNRPFMGFNGLLFFIERLYHELGTGN